MLYRSLLKIWFLPPVVNILLVLLGLWLMLRYRRTGIACVLAGVLSLLLLSLPYCANSLLKSIEVAEALPPDSLALEGKANSAMAIVVLGSGHREINAEYGEPYLNYSGVARLNYAAFLKRRSHLPLMVTGGQPKGSDYAQAEVMARYLRLHFDLEPEWVERQSRTTWENAKYAAEILMAEGIDRVVLVTESLHMRRSIRLFEAAGLAVVPAPVELSVSSAQMQTGGWLPSANALQLSSRVIHEMLGYWWYQVFEPGE